MTTSNRLGEAPTAPGDEVLDIGGLVPEDLEGATVYGRHDGVVGQVEAVVAIDEDTVETLVVEVGGFLGIGKRSVGFGVHQLSLRRGTDGSVRIYLKMTDDVLRTLPEHEVPIIPPSVGGYRS